MGASKILDRIIIASIKLVIVFGVLISGMFVFASYKEYPVKSFCNDLPQTTTPELVLSMAEDKHLPVFDSIESRGVITVLNQRSPFFRYACEVKFDGKQMIGKSVFVAD